MPCSLQIADECSDLWVDCLGRYYLAMQLHRSCRAKQSSFSFQDKSLGRPAAQKLQIASADKSSGMRSQGGVQRTGRSPMAEFARRCHSAGGHPPGERCHRRPRQTWSPLAAAAEQSHTCNSSSQWCPSLASVSGSWTAHSLLFFFRHFQASLCMGICTLAASWQSAAAAQWLTQRRRHLQHCLEDPEWSQLPYPARATL